MKTLTQTQKENLELLVKNSQEWVENENTVWLCMWTENENKMTGLSVSQKLLNNLEKNGTVVSWWRKVQLVQVELKKELLESWERWEEVKEWELELL